MAQSGVGENKLNAISKLAGLWSGMGAGPGGVPLDLGGKAGMKKSGCQEQCEKSRRGTHAGKFSRSDAAEGVAFWRKTVFPPENRCGIAGTLTQEGKMEERPLGRKIAGWRLRTRTLELGRRTWVCGVVNITPDSFSDGGRFVEPQVAIAHGIRLLDEGADLLDLGAESTRPGSRVGSIDSAVSEDEEQARVLPVLEGILAARPEAIVSIDTYKAATARAATAAGAEIVNDVSGLFWDSGMATACAESGCGVVLMHTRGRPDEWKEQAQLEPNELIATIRVGLERSLERAGQAGIARDAIVLDPGYGFGKQSKENFALLARQAQLLDLGRPLLAGLSRKSFLGKALAPRYRGQTAPVEERETSSVAGMVAAILHGASLVRVHRVKEAVEAALIADAVLTGGAD
jgi:dihydropteroate synthase